MRIFGAPPRYVQGAGVIDQIGELLKPYGPNVLVIGDTHVIGMLGDRLRDVFRQSGLAPVFLKLDGEITREAIADLAAQAKGVDFGIVLGLGGGKSLDAGKAVAVLLGKPVATAPTIASNDSPTSGSIAVYDDNHTMIAVDRMPTSPALVIVDTDLIAKAPVHFLLAGIGDAISKKFEADGCMAGTGVTPFGARPLQTAIAIADCCYRTIRRHGVAAVAACKRDEVDEALEAVVEATVLMSGLGFENGGLSLAHSLTRGTVKLRGARNAIHGFQVAWGLLAQLAAEHRPDAEITELAAFYGEIGLPATLADLGMTDPTDAEIREIAEWTMTAPHLANLPVAVDAAAIAAAIHKTEQLVRTGRAM